MPLCGSWWDRKRLVTPPSFNFFSLLRLSLTVYICALYVPLHMETTGRHCVLCSVILCLSPLRQGLSLYLELGWQPASPSDLPLTPVLSYRQCKQCLAFHMGARI